MKVVVCDPHRCLACHSCELACAAAHTPPGDLLKAVLLGKRALSRIFVERVGEKTLAVTCQHCEEALCLKACPTGALTRDLSTGAVIPCPERCIGCRSCVLACPFGLIDLVWGRVVKCDLCHGSPACVEACPTKALSFVSSEELASQRRRLWAQEIGTP